MLEHCRPTVEKYIFGKLHEKLFAMYCLKNEKEDFKFSEVSSKLVPRDLISFLGVREKFIFG